MTSTPNSPSIPSTVWKYLAPQTAEKVLKNKTFRFSPLNDRKMGIVVPVLNDRADCAFDFTDEVAFILRGLTFVDRNPPDCPRDPADTPAQTIEKSLRHQLRENGLRILSLSLTDPLTRQAHPLWGYYGESNQGICLELNCSALLKALDSDIGREEKRGNIIPYEARQVIYDDVLPKYPNKSLGDVVATARFKEAIFRKDTTWRHENEYRIVVLVDKDAPEKSILTVPLFTWTFPTGIITKIHLGEYCSKETIEMIHGLADGIPVRRHI
jgi:hypothetical protein